MVSKIVLLKVDTHQNRWPMAKVVQVCPNKHGAVRNIPLLNGSCNGMKKTGNSNTQNFLICRGRSRFDSPTRILSDNAFTWDKPYVVALRNSLLF